MSNWSGWDWIAYGCLGIAALGLAIGTWGKDNPEMLSNLPSLFSSPKWSAVPAILFVLATVIFIARLFVAAPDAPTSVTAGNTAVEGSSTATAKNKIEFIRNISLSREPSRPLVLTGYATATKSKLRVFVDYSFLAYGWQSKVRVPIGEINEPVKDQHFELQLIYETTPATAGSESLWLGDPKLNYPIPRPNGLGANVVMPVRARLVLIDSSGDEQHYYFEILRSAEKKDGISIVVFPAENWVASWQAEQ